MLNFVQKPSSYISVYAGRLGRLCYLQHFCGVDHPVYTTEIHLLQIAESKLREELLSQHSVENLQYSRDKIEFKIKNLAKHHISSQIDDDYDRDIIFDLIDKYKLGIVP